VTKPLPGIGGELLSEDDVEKIIDENVQAARIAYDAGADGIDVKLCHGFLGSQMLRPYNDRDWKYGGSWENRSRFAYELYEKINKEINDPNFLIGSKISVWEGFPGGFGSEGPDSPMMDMTEPLDLIRGLEERGAHYFIQSAGNPVTSLIHLQANKEYPFLSFLHHHWAKECKQVVKQAKIIGSNYSVFRNGKNNCMGAEEDKKSLLFFGSKFVSEDKVDLIGLGRQAFADPYLPKKLREGKLDEVKWCTLCDNCLKLVMCCKPSGCCAYNKYYAKSLQEEMKKK